MRHQDICWMSAADLAKSIRKKKLSPVEVVRDILDRIEVVDPGINAYVTVAADSALAEAKQDEKAVNNMDVTRNWDI
jgi:aspartyl-tRNA(Asn)/glutamyl-tRNA(Gln) amidotransferase subunit A